MWPFRKRADATPKTPNAVAYLKASVHDHDAAPAIELSHADSPVMKTLNDDLLVAYVVDTGDSFSYVQYRDLETDSVTEVDHPLTQQLYVRREHKWVAEEVA